MMTRLRPETGMEQYRPGDGSLGMPAPMGRVLPDNGDAQAYVRLDPIRSLQLHRRLAIGIVLGFLALAAAYVFKNWPIFTAQSTVYIQPAPTGVMDQGSNMRWPYNYNPETYDSYIQQQILVMTRPDVLTAALHKLGPVWQQAGENDGAAAGRLHQAIEIARVTGTYQVTVTAHASDPSVAAQVANAVANSYLESLGSDRKAEDAQRLATLRDERDRVQKQLADDRTEQESLNAKLGVAAIGPAAPDHYDDDIGKIREELIKARSDHDEAAARLTSLSAGRSTTSSALDAEADELVLTDPGLVSMKQSLNQRRAALITQMANLTPNNPQYKQDTTELAQIDGSLESMVKDLRSKAAVRIEERLRTDLSRTATVESQLNGQLGQLAGAAASATPRLQRASDLATDIQRLQTRFATVDEQLHNLALEEAAPGAARLSAAAEPPIHPTTTGIIHVALPLALAGFFFAIVAAMIANRMDPRVYIASDVISILGFAPMAQLPDFDEVSDGVSEEHLFRLTASIEYARKQGDLRNCIFTGAGPGAGVTTVVTRVRDMLEAMGRATVLVDASGTPPPAARAAQASQNDARTTQRGSRSTALIRQVAEESQMEEDSLVLTDTAPLAVSAETEYLARFVDCAIVVVESGVTTRTQLREVATTLQRLDIASVGFVLNRVGMAKADPAFKRSVHAVEKHLRSQSRSTARGTVRSHPSEAETAPVALQYPQESTPQQKGYPVASTATDSPVKSSPVPPERPKASPVPPPVPRLAPVKESILPIPNSESDMPWWLADSPPKPSVAPAPLPFQNAELVAPEPVPAYQAPLVPKQEPRQFQAEPAYRPQVPYNAPPVPAWDHVPVQRETFQPAAATTRPVPPPPAIQPEPQRPLEPERQTEMAQQPYDAASRIGGLRSLLFTMGLKNLNRSSEYASHEDLMPPVEKPIERPVYRAPAPDPDPLPAPPMAQAAVAPPPPRPAAPTRAVVAQPEFLPPKPLVETTSRPESVPAAAPTKAKPRDRRDNYDDVDILPSWRGQYKKK